MIIKKVYLCLSPTREDIFGAFTSFDLATKSWELSVSNLPGNVTHRLTAPGNAVFYRRGELLGHVKTVFLNDAPEHL